MDARTPGRSLADVAVALRLLEVELVALARDFNLAAFVVKFVVDVGVLIAAGAYLDAQPDSRCGDPGTKAPSAIRMEVADQNSRPKSLPRPQIDDVG